MQNALRQSVNLLSLCNVDTIAQKEVLRQNQFPPPSALKKRCAKPLLLITEQTSLDASSKLSPPADKLGQILV